MYFRQRPSHDDNAMTSDNKHFNVKYSCEKCCSIKSGGSTDLFVNIVSGEAKCRTIHIAHIVVVYGKDVPHYRVNGLLFA